MTAINTRTAPGTTTTASPRPETAASGGLVDAPTKGLFARLSRRFAGFTVAAALAAGITLATAGTAAAAMPGAFNRAQCKPGTHEIVQELEVYRSHVNEIVWVQAGLNNRTTGATAMSAWMQHSGLTNSVSWSNVTGGEYAVAYRWAVWDATRTTWIVSGWVLLAPVELSTFGRVETYPGTGVYISAPDATGRCSM